MNQTLPHFIQKRNCTGLVDWNYTVEFVCGKHFFFAVGSKHVAKRLLIKTSFWSLSKQNTASAVKVVTSARHLAETSYVAWIPGLGLGQGLGLGLGNYFLDCCSRVYIVNIIKRAPKPEYESATISRVSVAWQFYSFLIQRARAIKKKLWRLTSKNVSWFKFHKNRLKSIKAGGGRTGARVCTLVSISFCDLDLILRFSWMVAWLDGFSTCRL